MPAGTILHEPPMTDSEGYEVARRAALRVVGDAAVAPSVVANLTRAIFAVLWWGASPTDLRRIVEANGGAR